MSRIFSLCALLGVVLGFGVPGAATAAPTLALISAVADVECEPDCPSVEVYSWHLIEILSVHPSHLNKPFYVEYDIRKSFGEDCEHGQSADHKEDSMPTQHGNKNNYTGYATGQDKRYWGATSVGQVWSSGGGLYLTTAQSPCDYRDCR